LSEQQLPEQPTPERRKSERVSEQRPVERRPEQKSEKPIAPQQVVLWQTSLRPQAQMVTIVGVVLIVAMIIGALYLAQATSTATTGQQLVQLQSTRDYLQRANEETDAQIAEKRNISTLRGRAQALGFVPVDADRLDYMVIPGYEPVRATATPDFTPVPKYVYDETFNGIVQREWNNLAQQFEHWMSGSKPTATPAP
jgi:hypothetical protein